MYTTAPVPKGGAVSFDDSGASRYYTAEDAVGQPVVKFSPAGGSFKTETITVKATLSESAESGWYKIADGPQVSLAPGQPKSFIIGGDMQYGENINVTWGADSYTGSVTYRKVDPNAVISVNIKADTAPYLYAWEDKNEFAGSWPGTKLTQTVEYDGQTFYTMSFPDVRTALNIVINNGNGAKTADIVGITDDVYYVYNGATGYSIYGEDPINPDDPAEGNKVVYFDNSASGWNPVYVYTWTEGQGSNAAWPGVPATLFDANEKIWRYEVSSKFVNMIANNANGVQTGDYTAGIQHNHLYKIPGSNKGALQDMGLYDKATVVNMPTVNDLELSTGKGCIVVNTAKPVCLLISNLTGVARTVHVPAGRTVIDNMQGFYIVNGRKLLVK